MTDIYQQHRKFFEAPRWYQTDAPICEHRAIIHGVIAKCEGAAGHEGAHPLVATNKVAGAEEFESLEVRDSYLM